MFSLDPQDCAPGTQTKYIYSETKAWHFRPHYWDAKTALWTEAQVEKLPNVFFPNRPIVPPCSLSFLFLIQTIISPHITSFLFQLSIPFTRGSPILIPLIPLPPSPPPNSLVVSKKILSFNVWFGELEMPKRMLALGDIIGPSSHLTSLLASGHSDIKGVSLLPQRRKTRIWLLFKKSPPRLMPSSLLSSGPRATSSLIHSVRLISDLAQFNFNRAESGSAQFKPATPTTLHPQSTGFDLLFQGRS